MTLITALLGLALAGPAPPPGGWPAPPATGTVKACYDGDTCTLATGDKIRLKWVNTPELRPPEAYGIEARDAAWSFLQGKVVTLDLEGENPRDGYGRVVAGLSTPEGSLSIHLLEKGLGHVFIIPPDDTDPTPLLEAQARAQAADLGIWSTDRYQGTLHITSFHANASGPDDRNVNGEYLRVANVTGEPVSLDGYRITDIRGRSWDLSPITIPAGHTVEIHAGVGVAQGDPSKQLMVFLGSSEPIWNNKHDVATIYDPQGRVVDQREHKVKGEPRR